MIWFKINFVLPCIIASRRPPFQRTFQEDELNSSASKQFKIKNISDINETLSKYLDTGYMYSKQLDKAVLYRMEECYQSVFKLTDYIPIDDTCSTIPQ